jgi:dimethylaniline monooxygenase (N-oxide forming)
VQPVCAMMPIAELQSNFIADYLVGKAALPDPDEMERQMLDFDRTMKNDYTLSQSHTIQIDCPEYSYMLQKQWRKARRRAAKRGNPLPVVAANINVARGGIG